MFVTQGAPLPAYSLVIQPFPFADGKRHLIRKPKTVRSRCQRQVKRGMIDGLGTRRRHADGSCEALAAVSLGNGLAGQVVEAWSDRGGKKCIDRSVERDC